MKNKISFIITVILLLAVLLPGIQVRADGITILEKSTEAEFPQNLTFKLTAESDSDITDIRLRYTVDRMSFARITSEAYIEFVPDNRVEVEWAWDMRKTGGLPPGTVVSYWWVLEDAGGGKTETTPDTLKFDDNRFSWHTISENDITLYWYEGDNQFADALLSAAVEGLERLHEDTGAQLTSPVDIYIYSSSTDLQSAMIFPQTWTGGVAYPGYGTIAIGIAPNNLEWGLRSIVHELTHLVIHQMTYSPYLDIPTWLDEGLAMYMEGPLGDTFIYYLGKAIDSDKLISVRSLSSPFSAYADQSYLSYAESYVVVTLLINSYGQEKMLELLTLFGEGSGYDEAFLEVYGFDLDMLNEIWLDFIEQLGSQSPGEENPVIGDIIQETVTERM